jgi:hypothetical protein
MSPSVHLRRDNRVPCAKFRGLVCKPENEDPPRIAAAQRDPGIQAGLGGIARVLGQKFGNEDRVPALSTGQYDEEDRL